VKGFNVKEIKVGKRCALLDSNQSERSRFVTEHDLVVAVYAHHEDTEERPHVEEQYASLVREKDLTKSFITALLLVGNVCDAEAAVCNAIDSMDLDQPSAGSLIRLTVVAAIRSAEVESGVGDYSSAIPLLPLELSRLMSLAAGFRKCFVLRILLAISREECARLLRISLTQVDERACAGAQQLARARA
jgi:hypothetical protein